MKLMKHSEYFLNGIRQILSAVWVPFHCSIAGNKKADLLAKMSAKESYINETDEALKIFPK